MTAGQTTIFDFNKESDVSNWNVVDDVVMGGRSNGNFKLNNEGHGEFSGHVSLENNGGFSSLRYNCPSIPVERSSKIKMRIKGDGKKYQFRIKSDRYDRHSYISHFETSGEWQNIEILLKDMYPAFRGRKLNMSNFEGIAIEEIRFLIGNKKEEHFMLLIGEISIM